MILYFSATGNSKYCAEKIAIGTNDTIVSINDYMKKGIFNIDCGKITQLGIVCPTYDFDMSWAVADFIRSAYFNRRAV